MKPLILASGSPRRKDLLTEHGFDFEVIPPEIEEIEDPDMDIRALTALNAKIKGEAVSKRHPDQVIIAADTLVLYDNQALGKPADMDQAFEMLSRLNGNTHQVYTAVCLIREKDGKTVEFDVVTQVTFKQLSHEEMTRYHDLIDPLDKAGAYAAQDHGSMIIEKSVGSETNVIGLPMEELKEQLHYHFAVEPVM